MEDYHCAIEITITADSPLDAARQAYDLLWGKDALLPVVSVTDAAGDKEEIDLEEHGL